METHQSSQPPGDDLIFTVFVAAMSRLEAEREEFLRAACAGDDVLLGEVERRLRWERRLNGFLLTPVVTRDRIDRPFVPGDIVLRRFRILRIAGEGGMAVVYEALDEKLGHRIALKCPRFEFRKRLPPEALNSLHVTHPNVCRVFEIHTAETSTGDVDFITMEFLDGQTMASRLPEAPSRWLATKDGSEIARQICAGLKAVHGAGIIHRDLKASNVMLSADESGGVRAVIMDFGIAHGADMFSSQIRGTPGYLAPELWRGRPATQQSDLYALGVLLYEMASGHKPFPEETGWKQRLQSQPPAPAVNQPMRSALMRCMHPDPARRFEAVADFERFVWHSRRFLMRSITGFAATALLAVAVKEGFWPSTPVRLAILPPLILPNQALPNQTPGTPIVNGFAHYISYRFQILRARRPLSVFSLAQTEAEKVKDGVQAKAIFGATHVLSSQFSRTPANWSIAAALIETAGGRSLQRWNLDSTDSELPGKLFALQSTVVLQTIRELALWAEPKRQAIRPDVYADYLQGLHYCRFDDGDPVQAIAYFEKVITQAPDSALGYAGLAEALLEARYVTGNKLLEGKAVTALAKAEQLDPELPQVYLMSGRLDVANGLWERGLAACRRAAELDPNDSEPFIEMATASYLLNQPQEAEAALQAVIARQPGYYNPHLVAGELYYELRNFALAERHWLEAVRLNPRRSATRASLAKLYVAMGRLAEAAGQAQEGIRIGRTQSTLDALATLQESYGSYAEAIALYEEAIRLGPRTYMIWASLGRACRRAGREADALHAFRSGLENSEEGVRNYWREAERVAWCAYYHANLGEVELARSRASQALEMDKHPLVSVRRLLTLAYDRIHEPEAALRMLAGAPPDLLEELAHGEISVALLNRFRK